MTVLDLRALRILVTALLFFGVLAIVYIARRMFLTLLFAVFFAYLLEPAVEWVQRRSGRTRVFAIATIYLVAIVLIGGAAVVAVPALQTEGTYATTSLPKLVESVGNGNIAWQVGQQHGWSYATQSQVSQLIASHRNDLLAAVKAAGARAAEIGTNVGYLILIPIFALFFLKDKSCLARVVLDVVNGTDRRELLARVFAQLDRMLAQYIRAQLILAALAVVAYTAFLVIVRFPYALILGITAGILEFIPFVGPAITAAMLAGIGFFSGYAHWLLVLVFVGAWRLIQDYVNTPYFMSEGLELHPLAAIFGVLVGGEVFGIPGMFLSIPVIAGLRIVWHNWPAARAIDAEPAEAVVVTPVPPRARPLDQRRNG